MDSFCGAYDIEDQTFDYKLTIEFVDHHRVIGKVEFEDAAGWFLALTAAGYDIEDTRGDLEDYHGINITFRK